MRGRMTKTYGVFCLKLSACFKNLFLITLKRSPEKLSESHLPYQGSMQTKGAFIGLPIFRYPAVLTL